MHNVKYLPGRQKIKPEKKTLMATRPSQMATFHGKTSQLKTNKIKQFILMMPLLMQ